MALISGHVVTLESSLATMASPPPKKKRQLTLFGGFAVAQGVYTKKDPEKKSYEKFVNTYVVRHGEGKSRADFDIVIIHILM